MKFCIHRMNLHYEGIDYDVDIVYTYSPPDPGVYRYPDGSGNPPIGPDITVNDVLIHKLTTRTGTVITERWMKEHDWINKFRHYLLKQLHDLDPFDSIWYTLVEAVDD